MKKFSIGLAVLLVLGLALTACSNVSSPDLAGMAAKAKVQGNIPTVTGTVVNWVGDENASTKVDGKTVYTYAVQLPAYMSARTNASGPKITSNAHSTDFPGVYFSWIDKQKDSGFLKVSPDVFDIYGGFTLTKKVSNYYYDYIIAKQPGQPLYADKDGKNQGYVFYIPDSEVYVMQKDPKAGPNDPVKWVPTPNPATNGNGAFNINMVFLPDLTPAAQPITDISDDFPAVTNYEISFNKTIVDVKGSPVDVDWSKVGPYFKFTLLETINNVTGPVPLVAPASPGANGKVTFTVDHMGAFSVSEQIKLPPTGYTGNGYFDLTNSDDVKLLTLLKSQQPSGTMNVDWTSVKGSVTMYSRAEAKNAVAFSNETGQITNVEGAQYLGGDPNFATLKSTFPNAIWIWDRADSWVDGQNGAQIIHYTTTVEIPSTATVQSSPMYFSCDNAAVLYINEVDSAGKVLNTQTVANSKALDGHVPAFGTVLKDLAAPKFSPTGTIDYVNDPISLVYVDMKDKLQPGKRYEIVFYAYNADVHPDPTYQNDDGSYKANSNPALFIFGGQVNYSSDPSKTNNDFVNVQKPDYIPGGGSDGSGFGGLTGLNSGPGVVIGDEQLGLSPWFTCVKLDNLVKDGDPITITFVTSDSSGKHPYTSTGTATVQWIGDAITITLLGTGTLGANLYATTNDFPSNGNFQSELKGNYKNSPLSIAYSGQTYLYVRLGSANFYQL